MAAAFFLICTALLISYASAQRQQCYFPDGTPANDDFPCIDNAEGASACCGAGGVCLTNGLCFDGRGLNRGSCTDQTWGSNQCAQYCLDYLYSGVWPCDDQGNFACIYDQCSQSSFSVPAGRLVTNTNLINSLGLDAPTATVTSAADTVTATTTETARASGSLAPVQQGISTGGAAGIGAGIGVPLLIAATAFGALYLRERRKRRKLETSPQSMWGQQGHTSYDAYYKGGQGYQSVNSGMPPGELDTLRSPQELHDQGQVPELHGNDPRK